MAFQSPSDPKSVPERPLNKGMLLHLPSNSLEQGGMLNIRNLNVRPQGMRKRSGTGPYTTSTVNYEPVQGVVTYWKTSGEQVTFAIDTKFLYLLTKDTLTLEKDSYDAGTIEVTQNSDSISGTSTEWANSNIREGDVLELPGPEERVYLKFNGNVSDSSGNSNDGSLTGSVSYVTGLEGEAIEFPDEDSYVTIPLSGELYADGDPWTLSVAVNASGTIFDNGNVVIEVIDRQTIDITIRGEVNHVILNRDFDDFSIFALLFDGTDVTFYIENNEEQPQPLTDSDGVVVHDTGDEEIIIGDHWRIFV